MSLSDLLTLTPAGLYCPEADVHIDPVRPVPRALITHGHSDHARAGHGAVMATPQTLAIMALRYGEDFCTTRQPADYGEIVRVGSIDVSFHPAGHVLGSAQIRLKSSKICAVVSGDYKCARDPTCAPFELQRCDAFVTEATFGLPVFRHPDAAHEVARLMESCRLFPDRAHLVGAYSLGKAQRVMKLLREAGWDRPIWIHGAMEKITDFYQQQGVDLGEIRKVTAADRPKLAGDVIVCPPGQLTDLWSRKFPDPVAAFASGWMRVRARARQRGVELPLVVSDHVDWDDLCASVVATGASEIWVTHGAEDAIVHWCRMRGLDAQPLHMIGYGDEDVENMAAGEANE
ncbi:MAG: putative mRNA 3-end processing factor [Hyphomicrobiales bacterium]|jgi:putative mRNA 3-end processing factor|nr:putative mRNA 3-end processing factor [Hyphomicrobiales bacterium]